MLFMRCGEKLDPSLKHFDGESSCGGFFRLKINMLILSVQVR